MHGSGHVCDQSQAENGQRKGFPRGCEQGHQGVPKVQRHAKIHGVQLGQSAQRLKGLGTAAIIVLEKPGRD